MNKCRKKRVEKMTNFGVLFYPETRTCKIWDVERHMTLTEILDEIYRLIEEGGGGGGSAIWGDITGDIYSQTDLMLLFLDFKDYVDELVGGSYNSTLLKYIWDVLVEIDEASLPSTLDPDDPDTWPSQDIYIEWINNNMFYYNVLSDPANTMLVDISLNPGKYEEIEFILTIPETGTISRIFVAIDELVTDQTSTEYILSIANANSTGQGATSESYYMTDTRTFDLLANLIDGTPATLNSRVRFTNQYGIKKEYDAKTTVRYTDTSSNLSLMTSDSRGFYTRVLGRGSDAEYIQTISFNSATPFPENTTLIGYRILRNPLLSIA